MKCFLIALIACVAIVNCGPIDDAKAKAKELLQGCAKDHNISAEDAAKFPIAEQFATLSETEDIKCYARCIQQRAGFVKNKQVDVEHIVATSVAVGKDEKKTRDFVERCKSVYTGADTCDEAWAINKCYHGV